jgi:hypothetical protein
MYVMKKNFLENRNNKKDMRLFSKRELFIPVIKMHFLFKRHPKGFKDPELTMIKHE